MLRRICLSCLAYLVSIEPSDVGGDVYIGISGLSLLAAVEGPISRQDLLLSLLDFVKCHSEERGHVPATCDHTPSPVALDKGEIQYCHTELTTNNV